MTIVVSDLLKPGMLIVQALFQVLCNWLDHSLSGASRLVTQPQQQATPSSAQPFVRQFVSLFTILVSSRVLLIPSTTIQRCKQWDGYLSVDLNDGRHVFTTTTPNESLLWPVPRTRGLSTYEDKFSTSFRFFVSSPQLKSQPPKVPRRVQLATLLLILTPPHTGNLQTLQYRDR